VRYAEGIIRFFPNISAKYNLYRFLAVAVRSCFNRAYYHSAENNAPCVPGFCQTGLYLCRLDLSALLSVLHAGLFTAYKYEGSHIMVSSSRATQGMCQMRC
jgi:hypothetical protein